MNTDKINFLTSQKSKSRLEVTILLFIFLFTLFSFRNAAFGTEGDDEFYRTAIERCDGFWNWTYSHYHTENGRVIIHALLVLLTNLPVIVWKSLSALIVMATCMKISDLVCIKETETRETLI